MLQHQNSIQTTFTFSGFHCSRAVINPVLGTQAFDYIQAYFSQLGRSLFVNARSKEMAPMFGLIKEYYASKVLTALLPHGPVLDIGSRYIENLLRKNDGVSFSKRVYTQYPLNSPAAQMQHRLDRQLIRTFPQVQEGILDAPVQCNCNFDSIGFCACSLTLFDGIYAPNYQASHMKQISRLLLANPLRQCYFTSLDADYIRRSNKKTALGFDNECSIELREDSYLLKVAGQPLPFEYNYVNTSIGSWQAKYQDNYYLFEIIETMDHGDIPFHLVRLSLIGENSIPGLTAFDSVEYHYIPPNIPFQQVGVRYQHIMVEEEERTVRKFAQNLHKYYGEDLERVSESDGIVTLRVRQTTIFGFAVQADVYTADVQEVLKLIPKFVGRFTSLDGTRNTRTYIQQQIEEANRNQTELSLESIEKSVGTVMVAMCIAAKISSRVVLRMNSSRSVFNFKDAMAGAKERLCFLGRLKYLDIVWSAVIFCLITAMVSCFGFLPSVSATSQSVSAVGQNIWQNTDILPWMCAMIVFVIIRYRRLNHSVEARNTIAGTCVLDFARLDPKLNLGRHDPKWKVRDPDWHFDNLECDAKDRVAAHRIAPNFSYEGYSEPTVKHNCKLVVKAAAIRATSNKVYFEQAVFADFANWFRKNIIPEFMKALDNEAVHVTLEDWLSKYPVAYRDNIRREVAKGTWKDEKHFVYESFPKIELQFTEVPLSEKDTPANTCKERQISGPTASKKICANAFINALEKLAHNHIATYCGMKDWPAICKHIDGKLDSIPDMVCGAADGSGFDMTQFPAMHILVNELIEACLNHVNFTWEDPLSKAACLRALFDSLVLDVSVGRGALTYEAQGRASGDGWTTFGNTVLMMSYWRYLFHKAHVVDFMLLVKGDDVLFGFNPRHKPDVVKWVDRLFLKKQEFKSYGLGQICKFVKFGEIEEMDFLSNYFFRANDGKLRMTRIPARVVQSIAWSTKIPANIHGQQLLQMKRELCFSKGNSLLAWSMGLPIFEEMGHMMVRLGQDGKNKDVNKYADEGRVWGSINDRESYSAFLSERFAFPTESIPAIERKFREAQSIEDVIEVPEFAAFFI